MRTKYALLAIALAAATTISLTGCVDNSTPAPSDTAPAASNAAGVDAAAAALLPDAIKKSGKIIIGIDPTYPPNESKDDAGNPVGWDVELANAMAAKLGVKTDYQVSSFDKIIPSITGGTYDIGVSSFTDNAEREKVVDFVNYFTAGVQWAQQIGKTVDPANACGLTVAVQATTYEETDELPAKSKECTDAGKKAITILKFDKQDDAIDGTGHRPRRRDERRHPRHPVRDLQAEGQNRAGRQVVRRRTVRYRGQQELGPDQGSPEPRCSRWSMTEATRRSSRSGESKAAASTRSPSTRRPRANQ